MGFVVAIVADLAFMLDRCDDTFLRQQGKVAIHGGETDALAVQISVNLLRRWVVAAIQHVLRNGTLLARHASLGSDTVRPIGVNRHRSASKSVGIHDLVPCCDEVGHELGLVVVLSVDLGDGSEL